MKERSRTEYSIINIFVGIGGYIFNTILGFVCRMVFVQCLSADYLGVNGLFTNILTMLSLAELGVGGAIVFALYKPLASNDQEKIASLMKVYAKAYRIIGAVIFVVGLILMPFIDLIIQEQPNISESIYLLYVINLFNTASSYFFSYRSSLLIAAQRNYIVSGINYVVTILQSVLQMIFLLLFRNYLGYLLIQTIGTLVYNIIVSKVAVKQFPYIQSKDVKPLPKEEQRALFSNIRDLMIYKVSGLMVNSTDNILITFFNGLATTGIASNYTLLINTLNSLLGQVFHRVERSPFRVAQLEVQVVARRASRAANGGDFVALFDVLAYFYVVRGIMRVERPEAASVVYHDDAAVAAEAGAVVGDNFDYAVEDGVYRRAARRAHVHAVVAASFALYAASEVAFAQGPYYLLDDVGRAAGEHDLAVPRAALGRGELADGRLERVFLEFLVVYVGGAGRRGGGRRQHQRGGEYFQLHSLSIRESISSIICGSCFPRRVLSEWSAPSIA